MSTSIGLRHSLHNSQVDSYNHSHSVSQHGHNIKTSKFNVVVVSLVQEFRLAYRRRSLLAAILTGCPSCCHQWLMWVPVGSEPRLNGHKLGCSL